PSPVAVGLPIAVSLSGRVMAPHLSPRSIFAPAARRRRLARFARPRCEQLENRIVPALFNVQSPSSFTGLNNNGCVAVGDLKNDGAGNLSLVGMPFSTFSNNACWVGLADMTGDGVLDVVVGSFGKDNGSGSNVVGANVTIFQGNADAQGHGNFTYSGSPITTL